MLEWTADRLVVWFVCVRVVNEVACGVYACMCQCIVSVCARTCLRMPVSVCVCQCVNVYVCVSA